MKKVHIIKWQPNGKIGGVYWSYDKAMWVAKKANLKRKRWRVWLDRMFEGRKAEWVVQTFEVED